jgi:hypothetical protein
MRGADRRPDARAPVTSRSEHEILERRTEVYATRVDAVPEPTRQRGPAARDAEREQRLSPGKSRETRETREPVPVGSPSARSKQAPPQPVVAIRSFTAPGEERAKAEPAPVVAASTAAVPMTQTPRGQEAPTIRVSIGRIELTAPPSPSAASQPPAHLPPTAPVNPVRPAASAQSLDDYLKARARR